jgi:nucleoside-diphosphate-sugar epimerase
VFEFYSKEYKTPLLIYRLNYATEMRYGVLLDIAQNVRTGHPVDVSVEAVNLIWQGDANNRALLCLEHASTPPTILNITGPEKLMVRELAESFAERFQARASFVGKETGRAYLSNAQRSIELFGPPRVPISQVIKWTADWVMHGGRSLDKPTHFAVTDGQFLDQTK